MPLATSQPRRAWPVTVAAVLLGWCLVAWSAFAALINTAPFFGEQPTRAENIESGLALATTAVPLLLLSVLAVRWGSRWGIGLVVGPALLLVPLGLDLASRRGGDRDLAPDRAVAWADLGTELVRTNWVLATLLLVALGSSAYASHRARPAHGTPTRRTVPAGGHRAT